MRTNSGCVYTSRSRCRIRQGDGVNLDSLLHLLAAASTSFCLRDSFFFFFPQQRRDGEIFIDQKSILDCLRGPISKVLKHCSPYYPNTTTSLAIALKKNTARPEQPQKQLKEFDFKMKWWKKGNNWRREKKQKTRNAPAEFDDKKKIKVK